MKHYRRINIIALYLILNLSLSCNSEKIRLNYALELSGDNRIELQKVLSHYSKNEEDSLKLKAAKFLIRNMIGHYSISGDLMDILIKDIDSVLSETPISQRVIYYNIAARIAMENYNYEIKNDLENITSNFLINNIEKSFRVWNNNANNLSFSDFCEYILPYRLSNEPLVDWKDYSICYFDIKGLKNTLHNTLCTYSVRSIKAIDNFSFNKFRNKLLKSYKPDCIDNAYYDVYSGNNFGYSVFIDYVPHYANRDNRHFWISSSVIKKRGINNEFAKVFRKTFSFQQAPSDYINYVPLYINDIHSVDVTDQYTETSKIKYKFHNTPTNHTYAYLAVFNNQCWQEVAYSKLNNNIALFNNMGKDIVYMPTFYIRQEQIFGDYPIYLTNIGTLLELKPNKENTQNLELTRKYRYNISGDVDGINMIGSFFVATNNLKSNYDTLSVITDYEYMNYNTIYVNLNKKYKYYLFSPKNKGVKISSIRFFDDKNKIICGKSFHIDKNTNIVYNNGVIFDNNPLTSEHLHSLTGIELDSCKKISKIEYMSSTDDNSISIGDIYELFFFDKGKWVSLGKQLAHEQRLYYENAPTNALFWLRNHTKGKEERPFIVTNGLIRFF